VTTVAEPRPADTGSWLPAGSDAQAAKVKKKQVETLDARFNDHPPKSANRRINTRWYYRDHV
jgi:hypothetical protein